MFPENFSGEKITCIFYVVLRRILHIQSVIIPLVLSDKPPSITTGKVRLHGSELYTTALYEILTRLSVLGNDVCLKNGDGEVVCIAVNSQWRDLKCTLLYLKFRLKTLYSFQKFARRKIV